jgi:hypothetical protein
MNTWDSVAGSGVLLDKYEPCENGLPPFSYGELVIGRNGEARFTSEAYQVYDGSNQIARYQCDRGGDCEAFSYYNPPRACGCEGRWFRRRGRISSLKIIACSKPPTFEPIQKYLVTRSTAVELDGNRITVGPRLRTTADVSVPAERFSEKDVMDVFPPHPRPSTTAPSQLHRNTEVVVDKSMSRPTEVDRRREPTIRSVSTRSSTIAFTAPSTSTRTISTEASFSSRKNPFAGLDAELLERVKRAMQGNPYP